MYQPSENDLQEMDTAFLLMQVEEKFGKQAVYLLKNLTTRKEETAHGYDAKK